MKDGKVVPARSYLVQFERLIEKDRRGELTSAEYALLDKLDLAELHLFEQAEQLSINLLEKWLTKYKFKDWAQTESRGLTVTEDMKKERAKEIAKRLNDNEEWHSHGRWISRETLEREVGLKIDRLEDDEPLARATAEYYQFLTDYLVRHGKDIPYFVQSRGFV